MVSVEARYLRRRRLQAHTGVPQEHTASGRLQGVWEAEGVSGLTFEFDFMLNPNYVLWKRNDSSGSLGNFVYTPGSGQIELSKVPLAMVSTISGTLGSDGTSITWEEPIVAGKEPIAAGGAHVTKYFKGTWTRRAIALSHVPKMLDGKWVVRGFDRLFEFQFALLDDRGVVVGSDGLGGMCDVTAFDESEGIIDVAGAGGYTVKGKLGECNNEIQIVWESVIYGARSGIAADRVIAAGRVNPIFGRPWIRQQVAMYDQVEVRNDDDPLARRGGHGAPRSGRTDS